MIEFLLGVLVGLGNAVVILLVIRPELREKIKPQKKEKGAIFVYDKEQEARGEIFNQADKEGRSIDLDELLKDDYD